MTATVTMLRGRVPLSPAGERVGERGVNRQCRHHRSGSRLLLVRRRRRRLLAVRSLVPLLHAVLDCGRHAAAATLLPAAVTPTAAAPAPASEAGDAEQQEEEEQEEEDPEQPEAEIVRLVVIGGQRGSGRQL